MTENTLNDINVNFLKRENGESHDFARLMININKGYPAAAKSEYCDMVDPTFSNNERTLEVIDEIRAIHKAIEKEISMTK